MTSPAPPGVSRIAVAALGVLGAGVAATLVFAAGRLTFDGLDWPMVVVQPELVTTSLAAFIDDSNLTLSGLLHRVLVPVWGLDSYWPYVLTVVVLHVMTALLIFSILGANAAFLAFAAAVMHLFLFQADGLLLAAAGLHGVLPVLLGLGALALFRTTPSRPVAALGGAAILLSLASGPSGLPVCLAAAVLAPRVRRFPAGAAILVVALWLMLYGDSLELPAVPDLIAATGEFARGLSAALFRLPQPSFAAALLLLALVLTLWIGAWPPSRLARATALGLGTCLLLAAVRPEAIDDLYLYSGALLAVLLLGEAVGTAWRAPSPQLTRAVLAVGVLLWTVTAVGSSGPALASALAPRLASAEQVRGEAAAIALLPPLPSGDVKPEADGFGGATLAQVVEAERNFSGSILTGWDTSILPDQLRRDADVILVRALADSLHPLVVDRPRANTSPVRFEVLSDMTRIREPGPCYRFDVGEIDPFVQIELPRGSEISYRFRSPESHQIFYQFLADGVQEEASLRITLPEGSWNRIRPPELAAAGRWNVRIDPPASSGPFDLCLSPVRHQPQI